MRTMQETKNNDSAFFYAIYDHIRRAANHQFTGTRNAARSSEARMISQPENGCFYRVAHVDRGPGISFSDIGQLAFPILFGDR